MNQYNSLLESRAEKLFFYSPYSFVRETNAQRQTQNFVIKPILDFQNEAQNQLFEIKIDGQLHIFLMQFLAWDSAFFKIPTYKLLPILFAHSDFQLLSKATQTFMSSLQNRVSTLFPDSQSIYVFADIPTEDISVIQALTHGGFRQVETRLNYFKTDLQKIDYQRFNIRKALPKDIPNLERVAQFMRNEYDRFHADSVFSEEMADRFLAKYVSESVKGFADMVLVPNEPNVPSDGFLTAKYFREDWEKLGVNASRMPLFAVAPTCRGWGQKLVSEMTYHLREVGADYTFIGTQSANRRVCRLLENLQYRLGSMSHILSYDFSSFRT